MVATEFFRYLLPNPHPEKGGDTHQSFLILGDSCNGVILAIFFSQKDVCLYRNESARKLKGKLQ
jgi:hypothetical protein